MIKSSFTTGEVLSQVRLVSEFIFYRPYNATKVFRIIRVVVLNLFDSRPPSLAGKQFGGTPCHNLFVIEGQVDKLVLIKGFWGAP